MNAGRDEFQQTISPMETDSDGRPVLRGLTFEETQELISAERRFEVERLNDDFPWETVEQRNAEHARMWELQEKHRRDCSLTLQAINQIIRDKPALN